MWLIPQIRKIRRYHSGLVLVDMLKQASHAASIIRLFLSSASRSLCPVCASANDTGWPTLGKTSTSLKPPERRDSGTDTQGKSPPSGSPVAPSAEKVRPLSSYPSVIYHFNLAEYLSFFHVSLSV